MEKKIKDLKPPYTYTCLNSYTCIEIDGIPVTISIGKGKEKNKNTYQFQIIADSSGIKSDITTNRTHNGITHNTSISTSKTYRMFAYSIFNGRFITY